MDRWPTLAWILLMTNILLWLKTVHTRDFTMKDIILLHPSTTPHPGGFKCFACQDAADNYECNRWAPDVYCPKVSLCGGRSDSSYTIFRNYCPPETRYCYTLHLMDNHGDSVSVTKRCVTSEDCLITGCADVSDNGYQVCTSCCEGNICNVLVPRNESSATFFSTSPLVSSSRGLHPSTLSYIIVSIFTARHV